MKRANRIWLTAILVVVCAVGAAYGFHVRPVFAQQNTQVYDDGSVYIYAWVDVDSNYYLYTQSYTQWESDAYEDIDAVQDRIQVDEDQAAFYDDYAAPGGTLSDYGKLKSDKPVATGHEYGVISIGYVCIDDEEGGCTWSSYPYASSPHASVNVSYPPPRIYSITPASVTQGDQGTLTLTGADFIENSSDQLTLNFSGSTNPFTLTSAPSTCTTNCTATYSYDFTGYTPGTYQLSLTNNEASSDNYSFTVNQYTPHTLPPDPCAITSNPQTGYSYIVPTGTVGGSGTMSMSFSGAAFSNLSPTTVPYGPYSTPSSIASNLAALITTKYAQNGMFARAFGSNIIYGGVAALGTVTTSITGPSFTTSSSSAAASAAASACYAVPKPPCLGLFPNYDFSRPYYGGITETARQHITRKHIVGPPTANPKNTVYIGNGGLPPSFSLIEAYNIYTVLRNPTGSVSGNGLRFTYTFQKQTTLLPGGYVESGFIGADAANNDLYTNNLFLTSDRCTVNTSFPTQ
jgi:hypothetical protein